MVRVFCNERSMQKIWLWTQLGCNSDVRASVSSSQRIRGVIADSNGESEESGSRVRSMVGLSVREGVQVR